MGKSRKLSKGLSNGFVPGYHHAAEIMADSEGLLSSGSVDPEMTLSQDSRYQRQKCISVNTDGCNHFGVPVHVLSLSKISGLDRRDLEFKLRRELEQVRFLQKKVASVSLDTMVKSSSNVFSAGNKRPPVQTIFPNQHLPGKKQAYDDQNGSCIKRGILQNAVPANVVYGKLMKQCESLLTQMMRHKSGWVFNEPVDVVQLNIPDYFTIIKHPMDFGTIKGKIAAGKYSSPLEFAEDVRLTFSNAMLYNPAQNNVHIMAKTLSKYFESKWKTIEKKIPGDGQFLSSENVVSHVRSSVIDHGPPTKKRKLPSVSGTLNSEPVNKKIQDSVNKNLPYAINKKMPSIVNKKMSDEEKHQLSIQLESLSNELPNNIVELLKENCSSTEDDEIEIDINALNEDTLLSLKKLIDDYLLEKKIKGSEAAPQQIELYNEGGINKSSIYRGKGNDAVEEDIDIGGNDSPILSFPPIEIEKDAAHENLKPSPSRSSSSGSSSSDSGSSSGSEHDGTKAPNHAKSLEGTTDADDASNHEHIDTKEPEVGTETVFAPAEQNTLALPSSVKGGSHSEGEDAPLERQVSPEKVYRAALLKSRFADTIFKAQEKALDKGVIRDPENLRIEREKLERMQREEKARLQAAVLAAEEARKKAEAEAAADARRKREMEREAARLALQSMEKTVHINESCGFLEDLEMLRSDPPDDMSCMAKDPSLEHSVNMLGSFKLQSSSNALEQLGLYMKQDDDEEDEVTAEEEAVQLSSNPLEQLKLFMKQNGGSDDAEDEVTARQVFQSSSNPSEQLGLCQKQNGYYNGDDDVENDGSARQALQSPSNHLEQVGLYMKQNEDGEDDGVEDDVSANEALQSSSNPLEQLGLYRKQNGEDDDNLKEDGRKQNGEDDDLKVDDRKQNCAPDDLKEDGSKQNCDEDDLKEDANKNGNDDDLQEDGKRQNGDDDDLNEDGNNPLEQPGLCIKQDDDVLEDASAAEAPNLDSPLEQLGLYANQDDDISDDATAKEAPNLGGSSEQPGLCVKQDDGVLDDVTTAEAPNFVGPSEQPGLCVKQDDGVLDDVTAAEAPNLGGPSEQLGLCRKQDDVVLDGVTDAEAPNVGGPLEQLGLCGKQDDDVLDDVTAPEAPNADGPSEQLGLCGKQDVDVLDDVTAPEAPDLASPLEQLGLYGKQDDDVLDDVTAPEAPNLGKHDEDVLGDITVPEAPNVGCPLEQLGLYGKQDDDVLDDVTAPEAPNLGGSLEQLGLYGKQDDDDDDVLDDVTAPEAPNLGGPVEQLELCAKQGDDVLDDVTAAETLNPGGPLEQLGSCTKQDGVGLDDDTAAEAQKLGGDEIEEKDVAADEAPP